VSTTLWPRRIVAAALLVLAACATPGLPGGSVRLSDVEDDGDPARRASLRLVERGLGDESGHPQLAVSDFERAIQVDPTNPWAYLALARHYAPTRPDRALEYLDQAQAMLDAEQMLSPRVEPHLLGIRGMALRMRGDPSGDALLEQARRMAPEAWGDGYLSPEELR
jgi:hypothetical protein